MATVGTSKDRPRRQRADDTDDHEAPIGNVFARLNANEGRAGVDWRYRFVRPTRTAYDID